MAQKYGLNENHFVSTLREESDDWANIQSLVQNKNGPNGREDSWGDAQVWLPAHPEITRAMALSPAFSIEWAAKEWAAGNAASWTVYRNNLTAYGSGDWP